MFQSIRAISKKNITSLLSFEKKGFFLQYRTLRSSRAYQLVPFSLQEFAKQTVVVPKMGDSITNGQLGSISKNVGEAVKEDDIVIVIDTEKISVDIRSPYAGVITKIHAGVGDEVNVDAPLFEVDTDATAAAKQETKAEKKPETKAEPAKAQPVDEPKTASQGMAQAKQPQPETKTTQATQASAPQPKAGEVKRAKDIPKSIGGSRSETRIQMTRLRETVSNRLKQAQNTCAMLTTFNEVDMSGVMQLRKDYGEQFQKKHAIKLGFMSAFLKASVVALQDQPVLNCFIDGKDIVYRDYIDLSVAVAAPKGLVVPVIRNAQNLSLAGFEKALNDLSVKARDGKIEMEDMVGGTFTISNGGVFGSMMGTPIINMPQAAILGMHSIKNRAVVVDDKIVARPIMYLALTYDHRLIDGREAVLFLRKIKDCIEDPRTILLDI